MAERQHVPVSRETPAYICSNCGAIALDSNNICKVQGMVKKQDWCGTKGSLPPKSCHTKTHTERWQCRKCSQTAVNPDVLCEPEKLMI